MESSTASTPTVEGRGQESETAGPSGARVGDNTSPPPPALRPYGAPAIHLPAQPFHVGPSFVPGNYYQPGMPLPQGPRPHVGQFQPGPQVIPEPQAFYGLQYHPSGFYYMPGTQPEWPMPHNVQYPQGIHHHRGIPPPMAHAVQNPPGYHGMRPAYWRGFPLHDQAHDNRPTAPPGIRGNRPQPRRGGRTAYISQPMGQPRPRGHWRPAPRQTVAVHRPPPEPEPEPIIIPSVKAVGCKCPVCDTDVAFPVPGQDYQPGILPTVAFLPCYHLFHADCLDRVTPEGCSENPPPCFVCGRGDEE